MARSAERRVLDATALQGLAHPLRVRLVEELGLRGPATATQLAARLGESSGATSYHLRQLAKYGFVEEDLSRGSGRERWWRRVPMRLTIEGDELASEGPAARDAALLVVNELSRGKQARLQAWRESYQRWPKEWSDAGAEMSAHLRLTASELTELVALIDELVSGWVERTRDREGEGVLDVEVQVNAFPVGDPPDGGQ